MRKHWKTWGLVPVLVLSAVALFLAYRAETGYATRTVLDDSPLGLRGYLRQSRPLPLKAEMKDVDVTSDAVVATLCIQMPTREPWNPFATLIVGDEEIPNVEVRLLNAKDPDVMQRKTRCYAFTFPIQQTHFKGKQTTLRLESLWLELGNGFWNPDVVKELHLRAQKTAPGLKFEVVHERGKYGGGAYLKFHALPPGMTEEEATALLLRLSIDEIPVDWQTTFTLK